MAEVSKLRVYSVGIVAENKKLDTRVVEVVPIEDSITLDGEFNSNIEKYFAEGVTDDNTPYKLELDTSISVKATWLPMQSSNRHTAPDVRRGERVVLYRFADNDEFWWSTLKDQLELRKLETVIYAFSGTKVEGAPVNSENYYFLEISTHKKIVNFSTSKADGETWRYNIQINTEPGQGFIKIEDDDGQFIILDSKERQIIAQNKDLSKVDIDKRKIFIEAPDLVQVKSKKIYMESQENTTVATTINEKASTINETAKSRNIQSKTIHKGNHYVIGKIGATHGFTCGGGFGMASSPVTITGVNFSI